MSVKTNHIGAVIDGSTYRIKTVELEPGKRVKRMWIVYRGRSVHLGDILFGMLKAFRPDDIFHIDIDWDALREHFQQFFPSDPALTIIRGHIECSP